MPEHKDIAVAHSHFPHFKEYQDETDRLNDSSLTSADLHKLALQTNSMSYWVLTSVSPVGWVQIGEPPIFGQFYAYKENDTQQSTTSTTYIEAMSMSFGVDVNCNMRIAANVQFKGNSTGRDIIFGIELDGSIVSETNVEPKDVDSWMMSSAFKRVALNQGTHTLRVLYKTESSSYAAEVRNVRLEAWRV